MKRTILSILLLGLLGPVARAAEPETPELLVLVYFDQMRGDYLKRWQSQFTDGGFRRLTGDGAWFTNCHYPYSYTVTGAGHASVATGAPPAVHGIVGNDWFDRSVGKSVNCVAGDRYRQVPPKTAIDPDEDTTKIGTGGASPDQLLKPTIGDALKEATDGKAKVVGLSMKNRGAILPTGKRGDAVYWMDGGTGKFVTSTYYRDTSHPWVAEYNATKPADRWKGKLWERLRADLDYAKLSGPDDIVGESKGAPGQGRVFPHPFEPDATETKLKPAFFTAVYNSPFGNELLLELAEKAIDAEHLGADAVPDLLSLSFSSNDAIGHAWGPDSQEVLDVTLRSDLVVKRLLDLLDTKVGKGKYALALTADHGVCPLPEVSKTQGRDAARVLPATAAKVEEFLTAKFEKGKAKWIEAIAGPWIYLDRKAIEKHGDDPAEVEKELAAWLAKQTGVKATYTRAQLLDSSASDDPILPMVKRSFFATRTGDVYVLQKPYHLVSTTVATGTTHGTPYEYDTHVPLVVFGAHVKPGERSEKVAPLAAAAILAEAIGIPTPSGATTPAPKGVFEVKPQ